jgi:hypothetical protein
MNAPGKIVGYTADSSTSCGKPKRTAPHKRVSMKRYRIKNLVTSPHMEQFHHTNVSVDDGR